MYPAIGWEALADIQAPKDRAWAGDKEVLDSLTKCLEASNVFQFYMHNCALFVTRWNPDQVFVCYRAVKCRRLCASHSYPCRWISLSGSTPILHLRIPTSRRERAFPPAFSSPFSILRLSSSTFLYVVVYSYNPHHLSHLCSTPSRFI
jgi:hypothetical protein